MRFIGNRRNWFSLFGRKAKLVSHINLLPVMLPDERTNFYLTTILIINGQNINETF